MRAKRLLQLAFILLVIGAALFFVIGRPVPVDIPELAVDQPLIEKGAYLVRAGGCVTCHTVEDDAEGMLAGGRALETPFGTFYAPNITPHPETGIGTWTAVDFVRAMRHGSTPDGRHYYPAFPYPSYAGIVTEDLLAMHAYLATIPAVERPNRAHDLKWFVALRPLLAGWKWLHFDTAEFTPESARSPEWNRGAYLVRHLGHCGECHTPRGPTGGLDDARFLAGNEHGPDGDPVPNITQDKQDGIGAWSAGDIEYFLEMGMFPDGDVVGGAMAEVIDDNTSHLNTADREAIATFLQAPQ